MSQQLNNWFPFVAEDSEAFFQELGQRIATFRQRQGYSQRQLASVLDIKQQVLAAYEKGIRRIPASQLPSMSEALKVGVDDLLGILPKPIKRGPSTRLERRIEDLKQLPESRQKLVLELVETVLKAETRT